MSSKHNVAICMADPQRAAGLAEMLSHKDIEPMVAASSDELHHLVNYQRIDMIVLEHQLRGFLTGLDIFERMFDDLLRPVTVLLANATPEIKERAQQLGINRILSPDLTLPEIRKTVEGLISTSKIAKVVIPPEARHLVQRCPEIKPLPQLLIKLTSYLDADSVSISDLARDISVDPRITAELLKVINSSAFGLNRKITKIYDVINLLGVRRTVSLIISSSVIDAQNGLSGAVPEAERLWFNRRSVLIASTASTFAQGIEEISPDTAFVLGLFQDLGILVMANVYSGRYVQLLRRVRRIGQLRLEQSERDEFKISHAEVSAALLQKWNLPSSMVSMVLDHHRGGGSDRSRTDRKFLRVMRIGEAVADLADGHSPQRFPHLAKCFSEYSASRADQCRASLAKSVEKSLESSKIFNLPVPDDADIQAMAVQLQSENWNESEWPAEEQDPLSSVSGSDEVPAPPPPAPGRAFPGANPPAEMPATPAPAEPAPFDGPRDPFGRHDNPLPTKPHGAGVHPSVTFPHVPMAPPPPAIPENLQAKSHLVHPQPTAAAPALKVAIFEDEPMVVDYIRLCLERHSIEVLGFEDYDAAAKAVKSCDLIFVDLHLGQRDGTTVVKAIRESGVETPIVIISADRRREAVAGAILAGANDFLIKPFDQATLLKRISRHTGRMLV